MQCPPTKVCKCVWVPEVQEKTIECVKYVQETCTKKCPYKVCHMVPEDHVKTYTVCKMVPEQRVKTCTYQVCHMVPEHRVKTCTTRSARWCRRTA